MDLSEHGFSKIENSNGLEFFNNYFALYVLTINRVSAILGKEDVSTPIRRVLTTELKAAAEEKRFVKNHRRVAGS